MFEDRNEYANLIELKDESIKYYQYGWVETKTALDSCKLFISDIGIELDSAVIKNKTLIISNTKLEKSNKVLKYVVGTSIGVNILLLIILL